MTNKLFGKTKKSDLDQELSQFQMLDDDHKLYTPTKKPPCQQKVGPAMVPTTNCITAYTFHVNVGAEASA